MAFVIAVHHTDAGTDMHPDTGMGAVAKMCLGVFTAVGAALVCVGLAVLALGRRRPALVLAARPLLLANAMPIARARHGPATVSLLCVNRR